jgi:hypothetical protein
MEKKRRIPAPFLHQTLPKESCGENGPLQDQKPPQDPVWHPSGPESHPNGQTQPLNQPNHTLDAGFAFRSHDLPSCPPVLAFRNGVIK